MGFFCLGLVGTNQSQSLGPLVKREVLVSLVARCEVTKAVCIGTCVLEWRGMSPKGGFADQPFICRQPGHLVW